MHLHRLQMGVRSRMTPRRMVEMLGVALYFYLDLCRGVRPLIVASFPVVPFAIDDHAYRTCS